MSAPFIGGTEVRELVLASGNAGKLRELQQLLADTGYRVRPQADFQVPDAEETGLSFVENAILKARNACQHTGLPAIADDSGIAVDALQGRPGIYSARYAGPGASDADNNARLLLELEAVPEQQRGARYHCVLAFMGHAQDPTPLLCHGSWAGRILTAPQGDGGFGYDPLFYVPSHQCSAAQLDRAEKDRISHRAQASRQLRQSLRDNPPSLPHD